MTSRNNIRLLLADIDGTLLTRAKVLTEAAMLAVRDMRQAGVMFAITSGRPPRGMRMLIEPLALEHPSAGFNGGVMFNPDMSVLACHTLDPATAKSALDLILGRGLDAWIYTADEWLIRDPKGAPRDAGDIEREVPRQGCAGFFTPPCLMSVVKIVGISDQLDLVSLLRKGSAGVARREGQRGALATALPRRDPPKGK